jgi:PAS domain S-box-containing protein
VGLPGWPTSNLGGNSPPRIPSPMTLTAGLTIGLSLFSVGLILLLARRVRDLRIPVLCLPWALIAWHVVTEGTEQVVGLPLVLLSCTGPIAVAAMWRIALELDRERTRAEALHKEHLSFVDDASSQIELTASRFRDLVRISPAGVFESDAQGGLTYTSSRFHEISGRGFKELRASAWLGIIHPGDRKRVTMEWATAVANRDGLSTEFRIDVNGDQKWLHLQSMPKVGAGHGPADKGSGQVGVISDVTLRHLDTLEREELERRIHRREKYANLCMLAGGVANDFNNLLQGVIGNVEELKQGSGSSERRDATIEMIESSAIEATALARKMLTYAGRKAGPLKTVDMVSLVNDTLPVIREKLREGVQISFTCSQTEAQFRMDPEPLQQSLIEMAINAAEAYGTDGGVVKVRLEQVQLDANRLQASHAGEDLEPGAYLMLEVADRGVGMTEGTREQVIDPFFSTKFAGRGLGMAVVLGTVHLHGGALEIDSKPEHGTAVRLFLPLKRETVLENRPVAGRPNLSSILIVDDQEVVLKTTRMMLERQGFRVATAKGGELALEMVDRCKTPFDFILLDVSMPDVDGWETLAGILEMQPRTRVIMSSGYPEDETDPREKARGHVEFIQKPYSLKDLREVIDRASSAELVNELPTRQSP